MGNENSAKVLQSTDPDQLPKLPYAGEDIMCRVVDVYDGDTCTIMVCLGADTPLILKLRCLGIDTPEKEELLAGRHNVNEMADLINVDTLAFISIDGLYRAVGFQNRNNDTPQFCDACFSGNYPIALSDRDNSFQQNFLSLLDEQV